MAMNGPFQEEYWEANVLPTTWAFICKRQPDGTVKKFKARLCVWGDLQKHGVHFWETWSPVVQWSTVRLILVISSILNLKSTQADITAAFVHAPLGENEDFYIHQARGFRGDPDYVYKLNRSLCGLKQTPREFFCYLVDCFTQYGLKQSHLDPCLFVGSNLIVITYIDDLLIYSCSDSNIDSFITGMHKKEIDLGHDGTVKRFLGVNIQHCPNDDPSKPAQIIMSQTSLIKRIIEACGIVGSHIHGCETAAEYVPLPRDALGHVASGSINYASVLGMLLYLAGHNWPDITFAVHQCAWYTFDPKHRHEVTLKQIVRYLKSTADKGMILSPSSSLDINCYPDADFTGLYGHEDPQDPHCIKSCAGFVILVANCPILWKSRLQTEIAMSAMEAEYVALSMACKELFPLVAMVSYLAGQVSLCSCAVINLMVTIHEDNVGALTLGNLESL
ncbi:hypothetical protein ACHAXS_003698 [Conticribra weissflogii]